MLRRGIRGGSALTSTGVHRRGRRFAMPPRLGGGRQTLLQLSTRFGQATAKPPLLQAVDLIHRREVTPGTAVIPRREGAHEKQNQKNNQDGSKHTFLPFLRIQRRLIATFVSTYDALCRSRSGSAMVANRCLDSVLWDRIGLRARWLARRPHGSRCPSRQSRPKGESCARARSIRLPTCAAC